MKKQLTTLALVIAFAITPVTTSAMSMSDMLVQIQSLMQMVQQLQQQLMHKNTNMNTGSITTTYTPVTNSVIQPQTQQIVQEQPVNTIQNNCENFTHTLSLGKRDNVTGGEISKLQRFLTKTGDYHSLVGGYFGPATQRAVQSWQRNHGVVSYGTPESTGYGVVEPWTRGKMRCGTRSSLDVSSLDKLASINITTDFKDKTFNIGDKMLIRWVTENIPDDSTIELIIPAMNHGYMTIAKGLNPDAGVYVWEIPDFKGLKCRIADDLIGECGNIFEQPVQISARVAQPIKHKIYGHASRVRRIANTVSDSFLIISGGATNSQHVCSKQLYHVCGYSGYAKRNKTYANECYMNKFGANKIHDGKCDWRIDPSVSIGEYGIKGYWDEKSTARNKRLRNHEGVGGFVRTDDTLIVNLHGRNLEQVATIEVSLVEYGQEKKYGTQILNANISSFEIKIPKNIVTTESITTASNYQFLVILRNSTGEIIGTYKNIGFNIVK